MGSAKAGNSILNEVHLVKGQLHEVDLTNVSEFLGVQFLFCSRRVAVGAEPRLIFALWLGLILILNNEPSRNLGLAWIESEGLEQVIRVFLAHSLGAVVTLQDLLLNIIIPTTNHGILSVLLIYLKIDLELIPYRFESRSKRPVLFLNLNTFQGTWLALWVLPSIYDPEWSDRQHLLLNHLSLIVGHMLLFLLLFHGTGEGLWVEELLQLLAVLDLHSQFGLGVETEEDRAAFFAAGDTDDLHWVVIC